MKNLIDYASQDNGTEFRAELYAAIHDKVSAHIDAKKQEIASGLMGQHSEEVEMEESESLDEKVWDADGRNTTELKKQVRGLGDDHLKAWSKNPKSIFDTKTKKVQDRIISHEVKTRGLKAEEVEMEESTDWAAYNARVSARKSASPEELHAEFKKHANNPGHPNFKGNFSDDSATGGKTSEQKAIGNIAIGIGKADKHNYAAKIAHFVTPKH